MRKCLAFNFCAGLIGVSSLHAQETQRFTFDLAGGFTEPVGNTGSYFDPGWNVEGGGGSIFCPMLAR